MTALPAVPSQLSHFIDSWSECLNCTIRSPVVVTLTIGVGSGSSRTIHVTRSHPLFASLGSHSVSELISEFKSVIVEVPDPSLLKSKSLFPSSYPYLLTFL